MDRRLVERVAALSPRYNAYLLRGFFAEQIATSADFIGVNFSEAIQLFKGAIAYHGHRECMPEERAILELESKGVQGCPIAVSELALVMYMFEYSGYKIEVPLYIPYLKNGCLVIEDTKCIMPLSIKEQVFSRTTTGLTLKVMQQPIPFYKNLTYKLESMIDDESYNVWIPTTSIYRGAGGKGGRKSIGVTIVHYLLCKYGFLGTLARFGLTTTDVSFVEEIEGDVATYQYFPAKKVQKKRLADIFLKVNRSKLEDLAVRKVIASILYTVTAFSKQPLTSLYDPSGSLYRVMLGKVIYGPNLPEIQAQARMDQHIASLDTYLDSTTRRRLAIYNIHCETIYDLLQYVFVEIDKVIATISHTNLYHARIDVLEELLVQPIVTVIYTRWRQAEQDPNKLTIDSVRSILRFPRDLVTKINRSAIVQKNPPAYGDNSIWHHSQKVRRSGQSSSGHFIRSPDHRFHPSMMVVESALAYSKSSPGAGGVINPYLPIDRNGTILHPDYADEIDGLGAFLPYQ